MIKISIIALSLIISTFIGTASAAESFTFTRNITLGSRGADVSALQQILIDSGFLKISTPTNYFGPLTKSALSAWQASEGVYPASGFLGPISRSKITSLTVARAPSQNPALMSGCTLTSAFSTTTGAPCINATTVPPPIIVPTPVNTAQTSTPSAPSATTQDKGVGLPIRIKIPKIGVDAGFQYNGIATDGTMEIPSNVVDVGWYNGSVYPGEKGTSVITGHVAQIRGGVLTKPGVFISLRDLREGDTLSVTNDKGVTVTFVVRAIRNYNPSADATDVFTSNDNGAHLNIITCEGTWHPDQLSYSERLVVFTDAIQ